MAGLDICRRGGGVLVLYSEMTNTCNVCNKRVKSHDKFTRCTLCSYNTHFKCLPIYNEDDYNYAQNTNGNWSCTTCLKQVFPFYEVEDNEQLQQQSIDNITISIEQLNNMIFNPMN